MKRLILTILLLVLSTSSHAQSQTDKPLQVVEAEKSIKSGNYAIIVGVNDYWSEDISDLKYCENDAKRFADTLKAQGWDSSKIRLLIGPDASFEKITEAVFNLSKMSTVAKGSTIIFFFSGHGVSVEGKNYVVPYDGSAKASMVKSRNLDLTEIENALEKSPFARKLMFLDACRNEFSTENKAVGAIGFSNLSAHTGMKVILSTREGEYSREDPDLQSGIFTYFLIDALTNAAADTDNDGIVVINELEMYIAKQMDEYSFKTGKDQHVMSRGESSPLIPLSIVTKKSVSTGVVAPSYSAGAPAAPEPHKYANVKIKSLKEIRTLTGHSDEIKSVAFSKDGRTLASMSADETTKVWSTDTGQCTQTLPGNLTEYYAVGFDSSGNILVAGTNEDNINIINMKSGKELYMIPEDSFSLLSVAFSPDGRMLASGNDVNTIKLWSVETKTLIRTITGHSDMVNSVAFSPDGQLLTSGSDDQTVKIWNAQTGQEINTLSGHDGSVLSVAFSPDSNVVASGSDDETIKFWSVGTGQNIFSIPGNAGSVTTIVFSPDGRTLASGGDNNAIKLWAIEYE